MKCGRCAETAGAGPGGAFGDLCDWANVRTYSYQYGEQFFLTHNCQGGCLHIEGVVGPPALPLFLETVRRGGLGGAEDESGMNEDTKRYFAGPLGRDGLLDLPIRSGPIGWSGLGMGNPLSDLLQGAQGEDGIAGGGSRGRNVNGLLTGRTVQLKVCANYESDAAREFRLG